MGSEPTKRLAFYYSEGHEAHYKPGHIERPERICAIRESMEDNGWWEQGLILSPIEYPQNILRDVHDVSYLNRLRIACGQGRNLDPDTYTTPATWDLALKAAGGTAALVSAVWKREVDYGYAIPRPPGHHAFARKGKGFCLLNNMALGAEYLCQVEGAKKLAIIDVDLHHGDGTQSIFWERNDVLFMSIHQSPLYPGSGMLDEIGAGDGLGFTVNMPLPPASGNDAYRGVFCELVFPLLERFEPEMVLVSLGFDAHWRDPLGHLRASAAGFGEMVGSLADWVDQRCGGRLALIQEGGYQVDAVKACATTTVAALLREESEDILGPTPRPEGKSWQSALRSAKEIWKIGSQ